MDTVSIDGGVLLFTLGLSLVTGLFFGLFPAWHASRADIGETMKEGGRTGTASGAKKRVRSILVVAEVSISLVLLVGAGLMIKVFTACCSADPGFNAAGVLTAQFSLPNSHYKDAESLRQFENQLTAKLESIPGAQAAGVKQPLLGGFQTGFMIEGKPKPDQGKGPSTDVSRISPGALEAMGVPLLRGATLPPRTTKLQSPSASWTY